MVRTTNPTNVGTTVGHGLWSYVKTESKGKKVRGLKAGLPVNRWTLSEAPSSDSRLRLPFIYLHTMPPYYYAAINSVSIISCLILYNVQSTKSQISVRLSHQKTRRVNLYDCTIKQGGWSIGLIYEKDFPWKSQANALFYPHLRHSSLRSSAILLSGYEKSLGQRMGRATMVCAMWEKKMRKKKEREKVPLQD